MFVPSSWTLSSSSSCADISNMFCDDWWQVVLMKGSPGCRKDWTTGNQNTIPSLSLPLSINPNLMMLEEKRREGGEFEPWLGLDRVFGCPLQSEVMKWIIRHGAARRQPKSRVKAATMTLWRWYHSLCPRTPLDYTHYLYSYFLSLFSF